MKNISSTIIVFGFIFILVLAGTFLFDKINGINLLHKLDKEIGTNISSFFNDNNSLNISDNETL